MAKLFFHSERKLDKVYEYKEHFYLRNKDKQTDSEDLAAENGITSNLLCEH